MNKIELIDADQTGTPIDVDDVSMMEMDEDKWDMIMKWLHGEIGDTK